MVESFRVFDAVFLAQFPIARQHEFLDVVAIGGSVVIAQQRQFLALLGQLRSQFLAMMSARAFGDAADVGIDLLLDGVADIDDPRDFRAPSVVVFLGDGARSRLPVAICSG